MPEWPDLYVLRERLATGCAGRTVAAAEVHNGTVLRALQPLPSLLVGRTLQDVAHRGKFLILHWHDGTQVIINPMLTGMFALCAARAKRTKDTALTLRWADGDPELRYRDEKQMGKVYALPPGQAPATLVPGWDELGPPADLSTQDAAAFTRRARQTRYEVRNLLMDQAFLAGIGNAYADEILWAAQLHPKRPVRTLSDAELHRLHAATRETIAAGVRQVAAGQPPLLGVREVRGHMQVRGRQGQPCPRCGTTIVLRHLGYMEVNFCPGCQPAPPGQIY